jgi:hypothetical protein
MRKLKSRLIKVGLFVLIGYFFYAYLTFNSGHADQEKNFESSKQNVGKKLFLEDINKKVDDTKREDKFDVEFELETEFTKKKEIDIIDFTRRNNIKVVKVL